MGSGKRSGCCGAKRFQCDKLSIIGLPVSLGCRGKPGFLLSLLDSGHIRVQRFVSPGLEFGSLIEIELIAKNFAAALNPTVEPLVNLVMGKGRTVLKLTVWPQHPSKNYTRSARYL